VIAGFTGILTLESVVLLSIIGAMPKFEQHLSICTQVIKQVLIR
jgi:hypothetical protein